MTIRRLTQTNVVCTICIICVDLVFFEIILINIMSVPPPPSLANWMTKLSASSDSPHPVKMDVKMAFIGPPTLEVNTLEVYRIEKMKAVKVDYTVPYVLLLWCNEQGKRRCIL